MEKRLKNCANEIIMKYPLAKKVIFHGCDGYRENNNTLNGIMDMLGYDFTLELTNGAKITGQLKCGHRENYDDWGKPRRSFVLGDENDIYCNRYLDVCVKQPQIVLTGYEFSPGVIIPYALISWALLIRRVAEGKLLVFREKNFKNRKRFCWVDDKQLLKSNLVINNIMQNQFI